MKRGSCTVCSHPQRAEIDAAALARVSLREIASRYGRNKDTIQKHVSQHIPAAAQKAIEAAEAREVDAGDDVLAELRDLISEAKRLQGVAEKAKDHRGAIAAFRELVRVVELKAKVLGEIHENEINVNVQIDDATADRANQRQRHVLTKLRGQWNSHTSMWANLMNARAALMSLSSSRKQPVPRA